MILRWASGQGRDQAEGSTGINAVLLLVMEPAWLRALCYHLRLQ